MRKLIAMLLPLIAVAAVSAAPPQLAKYLALPDPQYAFQEVHHGLETDIDLTSQEWMGSTWKHKIIYRVPQKVAEPGVAILYITGDGPKPADYEDLALITAATDVPVATLFNVPNQPLFDGLTEDNLIAYTFEKFIETGDESWPALFPMTKSAIKAMDAIQQSTKNTDDPITRFVVTGASKRGWTTWMVGASADPRVIGIAPLVYDNLNIPAQMKRQLANWGKYSEEIEEYTKLGLQQKMDTTERGRELGIIVDPYSYRSKIKIPTMIGTGANDPYWSVDSLSVYWDDLKQPHWASIVPNAGHDLGTKIQIIESVGAFARALSGEFKMPSLTWSLTAAESAPDKRDFVVGLKSKGIQPQTVQVWTAEADDLDFRLIRWKRIAAGSTPLALELPKDKNVALLAQARFSVGGRGFDLSRPVTVIRKSQ